MNKYLSNLNKIEFVLTYACSGRCKHCSEGEQRSFGTSIDKNRSVEAIKALCSIYDIRTCMTFGGEPMLCRDTVYAIHSTARECYIEHRQLITNGYFTRNKYEISEAAKMLCSSGINDVLLSVDAFHQEYIPIDVVETFALELVKNNVPVRLQPAWLVSSDDDNEYNDITRRLLDRFNAFGISANDGNVIFPRGNALKYLSDYFKSGNVIEDPYVEDPYNVKTVSFDPDGCVLGENFYVKYILDILEAYNP